MKKKRYILFGYDHYYPSGGRGDEIARFVKKGELEVVMKREDIKGYDYYDLLDMGTGKWIDLGWGGDLTKTPKNIK